MFIVLSHINLIQFQETDNAPEFSEQNVPSPGHTTLEPSSSESQVFLKARLYMSTFQNVTSPSG